MAVPVVPSPAKMAEEHICLLNKELVIKAPKRSPMMLRMVVLVIAMVCGVYIFSTCFDEVGSRKMAKLLNIQVVDLPTVKSVSLHEREEQHCPQINKSSSESLYLHYPRPLTYSRQECVCNPVRLFSIISMQRSGSGWFETLLNSHMNISSNGEIFGTSDRRSNVTALYHTLDKVYNLDWFSSAAKNECSAAVGFKWMINQGINQFHEEIAEYFNKNGVSAIFLFRRNILRRMVSLLANSYDKQVRLLNGTHKSHVHSPLEAEVLASYKPKINITTLNYQLKREEQMITNTLEFFKGTRHIVLFYEDVVGNLALGSNENSLSVITGQGCVHSTLLPCSCRRHIFLQHISDRKHPYDAQKLREVQEFLGVPYRNLTSRQVKIHNGHLSSSIENWDEIERELKGTSFERFLHKDYRR